MAGLGLRIARGAALFLGCFLLVGLVGEWRGRQTDIDLWFVDLRDVHTAIRLPLVGAFGALLVTWAVLGGRHRWLRIAGGAACLLFAGFAVRDALRFGPIIATGVVHPAGSIPLSTPIAIGLVGLAGVIWFGAGRETGRRPTWRGAGIVAGSALACALLFPVAQMAFFGTTDYRRPADAAVVFGARVYADGTPSPLLADRIATAVDLYRSGDVGLVVMSGGDGADGFNEASVMRDVAINAGVDPADVVVDPAGVTTDATVANTIAWASDAFGSVPLDRVRLIAVSQAYHLPRIQLTFAAAGIDVLTVPAVDPLPIREMPLLMAREVPAFWSYYVRQCLG